MGLNLPKDITYLTTHDLIGIIDGLLELKYYDRVSDDIDDIKLPQEGNDVTLSIDRRIQYLTYRELAKSIEEHKAQAGSAVVIDAKGATLTLKCVNRLILFMR